jgi:hypothetical protein
MQNIKKPKKYSGKKSRKFWNSAIRPRLPKNNLCQFFSELFIDHDHEFAWDFFAALNLIFEETKLPQSLLSQFHESLVQLLQSNPELHERFPQEFRKMEALCSVSLGEPTKKHEIYKKRVIEVASHDKYVGLFKGTINPLEPLLSKKREKEENMLCSMAKRINDLEKNLFTSRIIILQQNMLLFKNWK